MSKGGVRCKGGAIIIHTFRMSGSVVYTNFATSNLSLATSVKIAYSEQLKIQL